MIRLAFTLIAFVTPPADRESLVGDTRERFDELAAAVGPIAARRWLWREVIRVVWHAPSHRAATRSIGLGPARKAIPMSSFFSGWHADAKQTLRALVRSPSHVLTAVLCLGVGIVASAGVFSIVNALFYGPLPGIADRDRLVRVFLTTGQPNARPSSASTEELRHLRAVPAVAGSLASEGDLGVVALIDGETIRAAAAFVTGSYFRLLGTSAARGRLLNDDDDGPGAEPVVVISHAFWRSRLAARSDVLGQLIVIGGRPFAIVGVAPAEFGGLELSELGGAAGSRLQFWLPVSAAAGWPGAPDPSTPWHAMVTRLGDGSTPESTAAVVTAAVSGLARGTPPRAVRAVASPLHAGPGDVPLDIAIMLSLFLFVPIAVFAIGCANVANLQLARATARAREISIRLSLGASRAGIVRLLTIEAVVLAAIACLAGLAGTAVALNVIRSFVPLSLAIDWRVLAFTSALAALVVALTGLAPAWLAARQAVGAGQRQALQAGGVAHSRLRRGLVGLQVALSLVLLVVAALFGRSLQVLHTGAPPVTSELLVADLNLSEAGVPEAERGPLLHGVITALAADGRIRRVAAEGRESVRYQGLGGGEIENSARGRFVTLSWFDAMDVRPVAGRLLTASDDPAAVVVNRRFAERLLTPPREARADLDSASARVIVGQSFRLRVAEQEIPSIVQIVGVIENAPTPPDPHDDAAVYLLMPAMPPAAVSIVLRTADPAARLSEVRRALTAIDPRLPWADLMTGEAAFARRASPIRYLVLAAGALGLLALALAAAGLYAVMSYSVALRRREIGVRMAVGARPVDILRMVLGQSVRVVAAGIVVGVVLVVPLTHAVRFLFVGVSPLDPTALIAPLLLLIATALVAGALPARRAARVDPARALRQD
jgi:predicted permease